MNTILGTDVLKYLGQAVAPPLSESGTQKFYYDTNTNQLMTSVNGGAWTPVTGGGATLLASGSVALQSIFAAPLNEASFGPFAVPVGMVPRMSVMVRDNGGISMGPGNPATGPAPFDVQYHLENGVGGSVNNVIAFVVNQSGGNFNVDWAVYLESL